MLQIQRVQMCFKYRHPTHLYYIYGPLMKRIVAYSCCRVEEERRVSEVGYGLELRAVGSRSVPLSQSWLTVEAVKIHLLPFARYDSSLEPGAPELSWPALSQSTTPTACSSGGLHWTTNLAVKSWGRRSPSVVACIKKAQLTPTNINDWIPYSFLSFFVQFG